MTLDTRVYVHDPIDYREVFVRCNQLIGAHEGIRFEDKPGNIWNKPGQGLCALLDIYHGDGSPLIKPGAHDRYCRGEEDECFTPCGVPCWLEVSFDTAYGYKGDDGEGCGDLHARLVAELGRWLDGKGIAWSWRNEFTSEVFRGLRGADGAWLWRGGSVCLVPRDRHARARHRGCLMTAELIMAVTLLAAYAMRLLADAARDKRAKAEAENKRQHEQRMTVMPGGAE